jgi:hypothetical protein
MQKGDPVLFGTELLINARAFPLSVTTSNFPAKIRVSKQTIQSSRRSTQARPKRTKLCRLFAIHTMKPPLSEPRETFTTLDSGVLLLQQRRRADQSYALGM